MGKDINVQGKKGVYVGTGGNSGNVNLRRTFDPRLTEEYQQACAPYARQSGDAEVMSMAIGASLWATALQTSESGAGITRTSHIGCQWGYGQLVIETDSPIFHLTRATGLTVASWQDVILVNQTGKRFWNELDGGYNFIAAAMGYNGDPNKLNGGGPIWAIFDADAVAREKWNPKPPNVDPLYFASGATLKELAASINNPYQKRPMPGTVLQETVERYNSFVTSGVDTDFKKPKPMYKIEKPPFYAAWATPILHDSLTGLRVNTDQQVIDIFGKVIPGLYTGGESMGGLAQHGLGRDLVSGRIAGLHAGRSPSVNPDDVMTPREQARGFRADDSLRTIGAQEGLQVRGCSEFPRRRRTSHEQQRRARGRGTADASNQRGAESAACCGGRRRHGHRLEGQGFLPLRMRPSRTSHQRHGARWRRRGGEWACRLCRSTPTKRRNSPSWPRTRWASIRGLSYSRSTRPKALSTRKARFRLRSRPWPTTPAWRCGGYLRRS